jgi:hypothetical protein
MDGTDGTLRELAERSTESRAASLTAAEAIQRCDATAVSAGRKLFLRRIAALRPTDGEWAHLSHALPVDCLVRLIRVPLELGIPAKHRPRA